MSVWGRQLAEDTAKKYIYDNLAMFQRVQVDEMIHLPCLTETDRQKIRASYTNEGNNETTFVFFQRLCCRQGWVPFFVEALREQHMGDLADKLESVYRSRLLPPPAALAPPAANRASAPPLPPAANEQSPPGQYFAQALPSSPLRLAPSSANPPPQDAGDYRTPIQENSHPAEKSRLAVHPKATDKGAEPGFSSASDVSSASNIGAAFTGDRGIESPDPDPVKGSALVPCPVEARPLPSQTISTSADGNVEQNWDGRQHRPVTVKNGCFGNAHRPEDSGMGSTLPTSANQPEEDYYSSDSVLLALGGPREDSAAERKVHVLRGEPKRENPPVVDSLQSRLDSPRKNPPASHGSPEKQTLPSMDPSSRRAPANDAQLPFTQTGTKPPLPVPNPGPEHPIRLPNPSDLDGSSSVETKAPKPCQEVSAAGGDKPSDGFKLPVKEKSSSGEITGTGTSAGRPQRGMETRPSAVWDPTRESICSEKDFPSKPGVLSSVCAAESTKLSSDDAGKTNDMYSGSSDRLRMSNSDSISESTSDSDPILISESSSVGHSTTNTTQRRNRVSGAVDATLPSEVDAGEEDTSFRSYHLLVEKNRSMDLTEAPLDRASLRPSPRDFPDSTSDGQPENKAKNHQAGPSLPDEKVEGETEATSVNFWMLFAVFSVAFLAYVVYKKK